MGIRSTVAGVVLKKPQARARWDRARTRADGAARPGTGLVARLHRDTRITTPAIALGALLREKFDTVLSYDWSLRGHEARFAEREAGPRAALNALEADIAKQVAPGEIRTNLYGTISWEETIARDPVALDDTSPAGKGTRAFVITLTPPRKKLEVRYELRFGDTAGQQTTVIKRVFVDGTEKERASAWAVVGKPVLADFRPGDKRDKLRAAYQEDLAMTQDLLERLARAHIFAQVPAPDPRALTKIVVPKRWHTHLPFTLLPQADQAKIDSLRALLDIAIIRETVILNILGK